MLQVKVPNTAGNDIDQRSERPWHVLNDLVMGRARVSRLLHIEAQIDGTVLTTYNADAVIVSTATGSTGYSLSAGGPILYPQSKDMVLTAVAPHLSLPAAVVLWPDASITMVTLADRDAALSVDGYQSALIRQGEMVEVTMSDVKTKFLRAQPVEMFFKSLTQRLKPDALF